MKYCPRCGTELPLKLVSICPNCHQPETKAERAERIALENARHLHPSGKGRARKHWWHRPYEFLGREG